MTEKRKEEIRSFAEGVWPVTATVTATRWRNEDRDLLGIDMLIECLGEIERLQNIVWEFEERRYEKARHSLTMIILRHLRLKKNE